MRVSIKVPPGMLKSAAGGTATRQPFSNGSAQKARELMAYMKGESLSHDAPYVQTDGTSLSEPQVTRMVENVRRGFIGLPEVGSAWTPDREVAKFDGEDVELEPKVEAAEWRNGTGIAIYLAGDRLDCKFAAKEIARDAAAPTQANTLHTRLSHSTS